MEIATNLNAPASTSSELEALRGLFHTTMGDSISDLKDALVACWTDDSHICIVKWDTSFFADSPICARMARSIRREEITAIPGHSDYISGLGLAADVQTYIIFNEDISYFEPGYLGTIEDFYRYMLFADKYMLNIPRICMKADMIMWLLVLKDRMKMVWAENRCLLSNIEQKMFDKRKFVPATAAPAQGPYPQAAEPVPKAVLIRPIERQVFTTPEMFAALCELLMKRGATFFLTQILAAIGASIEYYDTVFGNAAAIRQLRMLPVFQTVTYYAFRVMFLEELAMYHRTHKTLEPRFVISLDTAATLPRDESHYNTNSYMCSLAQDKARSNGAVLPALLIGARGLYTSKVFKQRLSVFTGGSLRHIDWAAGGFKTALSGSTITACAVITPLEAQCNSIAAYFAEYYPARPRFKPQLVTEVSNTLLQQFAELADEESGPEPEPEPEPDQGDVIHAIDYSDIDIMVCCPREQFDAVVNIHYAAICRAAAEDGYAIPTLDHIITENKYKYAVCGLHRTIDIFHVDSIPEVIVKYHLGCVRAWYDGIVHCMPTFVTAAMTGINVDIRWTSNKKDVRDIVLKYFQRGFGTFINSSDRDSLIEYVNTSPQWTSIIPPQGGPRRGYHAQRLANRFAKYPIYHHAPEKMFNPSVARTGIHHSLKTEKSPLNITVGPFVDYGGWKLNRQCTTVYESRSTLYHPAQCSALNTLL